MPTTVGHPGIYQTLTKSLAALAGGRTWLAGQKKRRIAAAGAAIVAALAGSPMAGVPRRREPE